MIDALAKALWDHMQKEWPPRLHEAWDGPEPPGDYTYRLKREYQRAHVRALLEVMMQIQPSEAVWGGLARDLVMWDRFSGPTGKVLYQHLSQVGRKVPDWLRKEITDTDHVPSKGTVAVCIFRAMIEAILKEETKP